MGLLREDIRGSLVQAGQKACGYMNCKLFVQTVTGVPKLDELPSRPFSSEADLVAGDVLKWGTGQHWAIYIGNGDIMEVEEWGADSRTVSLAEVLEEMDPPDMVFSTAESQHEGLLREYIRELLTEDAMGFVHDLAAADKEFGAEGEDFYGGDPGKGGGRAIKRAFNAHADHKWLSTLDTVHWTGEIYDMEALVGKGKDELSTMMFLPGENFIGPLDYALWIKGRITLAANDQDKLWSGWHKDYSEGTEEEVTHRDKSSGRNKRPQVSKDYSRYGGLKRGNEYAEKVAKQIPYVLDQSMWSPAGSINEALVDNWKPLGIILTRPDEMDAISGLDYIEGTKEDIEEEAIGVIKQIMLTALAFGVPVYDDEREELWSPL